MSRRQLPLFPAPPGYWVGSWVRSPDPGLAEALGRLAERVSRKVRPRRARTWFQRVHLPYGFEEWGPEAARTFGAECVLASWAAGAAGLPLRRAEVAELLRDVGLEPVLEAQGPPVEWEELPALASALHERLCAGPVRRRTGSFQTPPWLVSLVLEPIRLDRKEIVVEPSCGFGAFLLPLSLRLGPSWPRRLAGLDVSPGAVAVSRILLAGRWQYVLGRARAIEAAMTRVRQVDLFRIRWVHASSLADLAVGNPPWVAWEQIPPAYRRRLAEAARQWPELVPSGGFEASLGGASDDLASLFVMMVAAKLVQPGGELHFVFKRSVLENRTGRAFRAGVLSGGPLLGFQALEDLGDCGEIFGRGGGRAAVIRARTGRPCGERLPVRRWSRKGDVVALADQEEVPADREGNWTIARSLGLRQGSPLGARVRHGLKHDAEAVFAFERIELGPDGLVSAHPARGGEPVLLEPDRLFPYVKSRHIRPWRVAGWRYVLAVQDKAGEDVADLPDRLPRTWAYLQAHRKRLEARRSRVFRNGPFHTMFGLGDYSWAEFRVVWVGMGFRPQFAVLEWVDDPVLGRRPALVDGACYQVATESEEEAWFLAGLLNCEMVRKALERARSGPKRGLGKQVLSSLWLPSFDSSDPGHLSVAWHARQAARGDASAAAGLEEAAARVLWKVRLLG